MENTICPQIAVTELAETMPATVLIATLEALLPQLAEMIEEACYTVTQEFTQLRWNDEESFQRSQSKIIVALQFQDRHQQVMQDVTLLLAQLRQSLTDETITMSDIIHQVRLTDVRELLRTAMTGKGVMRLPISVSEIELF